MVRGSAPHDVAPVADGGVWYTGQAIRPGAEARFVFRRGHSTATRCRDRPATAPSGYAIGKEPDMAKTTLSVPDIS